MTRIFHGVACLELDKKLIVAFDFLREINKLNVGDAAATLHHFFGHRSGIVHEALLDGRKQFHEFGLVAIPTEMHLAYLADIHDFGMETASFAPKLCSCRSRRHHRALLDDHRDDIVFPIDGDVGRNAVRNIEIGDGVLAELIKELLLLRITMSVTLQKVDDLPRILEVVGNQLQLLFLEELGKTFFYAIAIGHLTTLPLL